MEIIVTIIFFTTFFPIGTSEFSFENTLYVGGSGPGNYTKIQDAIDNASDGDAVFVYNGTYYENVITDKAINLVGEDKNSTIIDGSGNRSAIRVIVDDVTVAGFTIQNSGEGIYIDRTYNCIISTCRIINNDVGIFLLFSYNNTISDNVIYNHNNGIQLENAGNNNIKDNVITNHDLYGIYLDYSSNNNTISANNIIKNNQGIWIWASCYNDILKNNITENNYGIILNDPVDNKVSGNNFTSNSIGFCCYDTIDDNLIYDNIFFNNTENIRVLGHPIIDYAPLSNILQIVAICVIIFFIILITLLFLKRRR